MEKLAWREILKNKHIFRLFIILFIGIALLLFSGKPKENAQDTAMPVQQPYAETERRLETILHKIKGVGAVEVMVTYEGSGKREYVTDVNRTRSAETDKNTSSESVTVVLPDDAPVLAQEAYPKVRGVLVVCEGAGDARVREQVVSAIKAVLAVEEHRIGVFAG